MSVSMMLLSGCASLTGVAERENRLVIETATLSGTKKAGAIYVWPPYASAAVVDDEGNRCVLAASGAKTFQAEAEAGLKIEGLEKVLGSVKLDATDKEKLIEAFTKISQQDADGAFADIALFHLCMLDQNGTFSTDSDTGQIKAKAKPMLEAYLKTVEIARARANRPAADGGAAAARPAP